jgi:hypothetical protein
MVEWLAGNRIRGTSAEKPALGLPSGSVGGWKELGRTTAGSAVATLGVASLTDKRYYMVLCSAICSGTVFHNIQYNSDTGTNYAYRYSDNGGGDGTTGSSASTLHGAPGSTTQSFSVGYTANLATKEKLVSAHGVSQSTAGAATAPTRRETVGKWANTSVAVNEIDFSNGGGGNFNTNSEVVVLGWDPDDTHTTNFWEELASVNADGTGTGLDSGVFTAKKYLWIQSYTAYGSGSHISPQLQVGNGTIDTGANYAVRYSDNGTADNAWTGTSNMNYGYAGSADNKPIFTNTFIINNAGQEKLSINHAIEAEGSGTAPTRIEDVGKWANTSAQINRVQWGVNTGNISNKSTIKVWGSD